MESPSYGSVRQKGSHNSYQRTEGYLDQALYWRNRSLEIDIHNGNDDADWPPLDGDAAIEASSIEAIVARDRR